MSQISIKYLPLFLLLISVSAISQASDLKKEQRWADQVVDAVMVGEPLWLNDNKSKFLSLYTENNTEKEYGAVIIVHGMGVHPNWPDIIHPLRSQLPELGWHTLSIQMPILPNDAEDVEYAPLFPEIAPRLHAAEKFLIDKGIKNIVVVAHSLGATMTAYYLANNKSAIRAMVAIGATGAFFKIEKLNFFDSLKKIKIPLMEIYGSEDINVVMNSARKKAEIAKEANIKGYQQIKVSGANHFFTGKEEQLIQHINEWLVKISTQN